MDPFTILMLASSASSILGSVIGGNAERDKAKQDAQRQKAQMGFQNQQLDAQIQDQTKGRDAAEGSLLAGTSALGVGGPSVDMMRGQTIGEYNRAIYQSQQQKDQVGLQQGYLNQDMADFEEQSKFNEAVGIGSTLLTTGVSYYSRMAQLGGGNTGLGSSKKSGGLDIIPVSTGSSYMNSTGDFGLQKKFGGLGRG